VAALAVAGVMAGVFLYGRSVGLQEGRVAVLADTVEAYKKRTDVDATVRNMDAVALCVELGGVQSDCEQLRGVE
jgi:hypothetical protein